MNRGTWLSPGGFFVSREDSIYLTSSFSSIQLNRRSSAVGGPTGVYMCFIPDAWNIVRTLSITIGEFWMLHHTDCDNIT